MKKAGVNRKAKVTVGSRYAASTSSTLDMGRREEQLADAKAARWSEIASMLFLNHLIQSHLISVEMNNEQRQSLFESLPDFDMANPELMDEDDVFMHPPVGDEGTEHSHAGGDHDIIEEMEENLSRRTPK